MGELKDRWVSVGPEIVPGKHVGVINDGEDGPRPTVLLARVEGEPLTDDAMVLDNPDEIITPYSTVGELRSGARRANSRAYRDGWDRVFGGKRGN
jgi:hypothetical protein